MSSAPKDLSDPTIKQIYSDITSLYSLTCDRTKTLDSQASSLLSYAGIIQTFLIAAIAALSVGSSYTSTVKNSSYYPLVVALAAVGFTMYMVTVFTSLYAFREPSYKPAPQPLGADIRGYSLEQNEESKLKLFQIYLNDPSKFNISYAVLQVVDATEFQASRNKSKQSKLKFAILTLSAGLFATTVFGMILVIIAL